MAWTTPRTWVSGELVKEGDLNQHIRDNQTILKVSIDDTGKIRALSSTYLADLSGVNLTGIAKLASANAFTGTTNFGAGASGRLIVPVGADKWGT
jgi:hypothetical protein